MENTIKIICTQHGTCANAIIYSDGAAQQGEAIEIKEWPNKEGLNDFKVFNG